MRFKKAEEKAKAKGHRKGLERWFRKAAPAHEAMENVTMETFEQLIISAGAVDELSPQGPSRCQVAIKEVDEQEGEGDRESLSPSDKEDKGAGDFEEIFASLSIYPDSPATLCPTRDPLDHSHPLSPFTPIPAGPSGRSGPLNYLPNCLYIPGPISFTPADHYFVYSPSPQLAGPPGRPPLAQKVETVIIMLNSILHPSQGPNTVGYKSVEMN
jgi:hypothetical protein